jgi:hypothetical protein
MVLAMMRNGGMLSMEESMMLTLPALYAHDAAPIQVTSATGHSASPLRVILFLYYRVASGCQV